MRYIEDLNIEDIEEEFNADLEGYSIYLENGKASKNGTMPFTGGYPNLILVDRYGYTCELADVVF